MPELILASTSPYRRLLLERLGVPFRSLPPRVDEEALKSSDSSPLALAELLACAKAGSLASAGLLPDAVIIGSDQLVDLDGEVFGKPGSVERAVEQLEMMSGRAHRLITALAVWHGGETILHVDIAILTMRPLHRKEIERYIAADRPLDCAGSYKVEARGISLFERIEAEDHTAIMGLPLIALTGILKRLGMEIP